MSGTIVTDDIDATGGTIGGFELTAAQINSANDKLILKDSGQITGSAVSMSGTIVADSGNIGGFIINSTEVKSKNNSLVLKSNGQLTGSAVSMSGTIVTDDITANHGVIGGFGLAETTISSSNNNLILKSSGQITASAVSMSGTITANSGLIGGFEIDSNNVKSANLTMSNANGGKISLNQDNLFLSGSGEGKLAKGNITFDQFGNVDITDARLRISTNGFPIDAFNASTGKFIDTLPDFGNVKIAAFEDGTVVTRTSASGEVRDTLTLSASQVSTNMSDRKSGDVYDANRPISAHSSAGMELAPLSSPSKLFVVRVNRDNPASFQFYSPFGDAEVHLASGSNDGTFPKTRADVIVSQSQVVIVSGSVILIIQLNIIK